MKLRAIILNCTYLLLFCFLSIQLVYGQGIQSGQWSWISGNNTKDNPASHVIKGPHPNNQPGSRNAAVSWTDASGNLWLFGGDGYSPNVHGYLNDLWQYNTVNKLWSWVSGDNTRNNPGVYVTKGPHPDNHPAGRNGAVSWIDATGNLWLFGGHGYISNGEGNFNDLWQYNTVNKQWSWISGDNTRNNPGVYVTNGPHPNNQPGSRSRAVSWIDGSGNLWLFGGYGTASNGEGYLNDLWQYNTVDKQWSWISGDNTINNPGVYITKGPHLNNKPGGRNGAVSWIDGSGNLWLFGGYGHASNGEGYLNDLWQYNTVNKQWSWISGDNTRNNPGVYVTKGPHRNNKPASTLAAVSWIDATGNLWLFGGEGYASNGREFLNELWQYNPKVVDAEWNWIGGDNTRNNPGVYASNEPHPDNKPGSRISGPVSWTDATGNLWLFGGYGYATNGNGNGWLNDLWEFVPCTLPSGTINLSSKTLCFGESVNLVVASTDGTSYQWYRNDNPITGATTASYSAKDPGIYKVRIYKGGCSALAGNSAVITVNPPINATAGAIVHATCTSSTGSATITATGGTAPYTYNLDGGSFGALNMFDKLAPGNHIVTVKDKEGCTFELKFNINTSNSTLTATASDIVHSTCTSSSGSATIIATGGTAPYTYNLDGGSFGSLNKFDKLAPGNHKVVVKDKEGCTFDLAIPEINSTNLGVTYNAVIVTPGKPYALSARAIGNTYLWSPSNSIDDPTSRTPRVTTSTDQTYLVTILAASGCTTVDTQEVKVAKPVMGKDSIVTVPTAFTPNNNGRNDRLRPIPYNIDKLLYFKVYNRWGQLVFETKTIGEGWDGTLKGKPQPTETYTWILACTTGTKTIKQRGRSLLIR